MPSKQSDHNKPLECQHNVLLWDIFYSACIPSFSFATPFLTCNLTFLAIYQLYCSDGVVYFILNKYYLFLFPLGAIV